MPSNKIAVVAAVGGEIKRHAHTLPARRQSLAIKRVGRLGGRKPGVLANRPRAHGIHRGLRAAHIGRKAGQSIRVLKAFQIGSGIERLDVQALGCLPSERIDIPVGR